MFDLTGKVAVVTGSTQGIGKAIARACAQAGAKVVISSRKAEVCQAVVEEFRAEGLDAISIPCHVGHRDQLENLVQETLSHWGQIDILVCNAATNPVYGPMLDLTDEAFDKIMGTNVRSVLQLCNLVCPGMAERGDGSVILISSIAGLRGNEVIGAYGISKAAEAGLARNLAVEWGPKGIRANTIAPGLVKTAFAQALWEDPVRLERAENKTPLRRIGEPEDIAGIAVFLASKASAYMTGQTLVADGGETIC
ncbi:SDR family NAD(P)-dependent oxidoreductase [Rhodovibrionaceae bacterium A322]